MFSTSHFTIKKQQKEKKERHERYIVGISPHQRGSKYYIVYGWGINVKTEVEPFNNKFDVTV